VVYPEENTVIGMEEKGQEQEHSFTIKSAYAGDIENKQYYFLTVNAPSLLNLRRKYGLPDLLSFKSYLIEFHITFGVRMLGVL
jgi:hypothetical protein